MNLLQENPYKILGVDRNASHEEIKQAYFAQIREHSPEHDPEGFKRIRAAYEKLRGAGDRAKTDLLVLEEDTAPFEALRYTGPRPEISPAQIKADLITLEALQLMEASLAAVSSAI